MTELRKLALASLNDAVTEAKSLLAKGYVQQGNWSLGQICRHLCLVQDPAIDGYPKWFSLFAPLRPLMRFLMLKKILSGQSPHIRTISNFVPAEGLDDAAEVATYEKSVARIKAHEGKFYPHPGFGNLPRETLFQFHAAHAAHHLRFLDRDTK